MSEFNEEPDRRLENYQIELETKNPQKYMPKCKHHNLIRTIKEKLYFKDGYYETIKRQGDNYDTLDYLIDECNGLTLVCEDCGECLEEIC